MAATADQVWRRLALVAIIGAASVLATSQPRATRAQTPPPQAATAALGDQIPLRGLDADHAGLALWNAGPGASEVQKTGHLTPWTTCSTSAPYYLATRDFSNIDAVSTAGLQALATVQGLPGLSAALTSAGVIATDLSVSWSAQSLGADVEGADWMFDPVTNIETRYYSGGTFAIKLGGTALVGGSLPVTTLTIDYNALADCTDDALSARTIAVIPQNLTDGSTATNAAALQTVAAALVSDLAGHGLAFAFDTLAPVASPLTGAGRTGSLVDVTSGRLEVDAVCSCALDIRETDATHEWALIWPEPTLPLNGPIQLKVVADTPAPSATTGGTSGQPPAAAPPGSLTLTVFDESAPTVGVILDLAYPTVKGSLTGWIDLDIQPQTRYVFTLRHSGAGRHYRIGTSHPSLELSQSDQRYLPGVSQDWALDAAAAETLQLELATDTVSNGATQATSAIVTIRDHATDALVHGPTLVAFTAGTPQTVSFQNSGAARRLRVQVDPDGAFRMKRLGNDPRLLSLECPLRDGPETPILTITDNGVSPGTLQIEAGQQFLLVNLSSTSRQISSNPHPIHTDCPPLNQPGFLPPGGSGLSGIFTTAGSCGFHDHRNPIDQSMRGAVVAGAGGTPSDDETPAGNGGVDYLRR